ncbi:MAG: LiaF-related protein [Ignavibacteriaceae bacterium]
MRKHDNCVSNYGGRATVGGILIFIGVLFLLKSLDIIHYNLATIIFTPAFFFFIMGILILINSNKKVFGAILSLFGAVWLLPKIFPSIDINHEFIIPLAVISLGIYIIFKHRNSTEPPPSKETSSFFHSHRHDRTNTEDYTVKRDYIDDVAIFGGGQRVVYSDSFKGGNITAIFGGSEINLTNCKLADGSNVIDVIAIFGGAEIRVPRDWNVVVNATPIFGGFSNRIIRDPDAPIDISKTLVIKGIAMFGGIEINSKKS